MATLMKDFGAALESLKQGFEASARGEGLAGRLAERRRQVGLEGRGSGRRRLVVPVEREPPRRLYPDEAQGSSKNSGEAARRRSEI